MSDEQAPSLYEALARVQNAVVVPKARYNQFGKFSYRSFEDIVAAIKPACDAEGLVFTLTDEIVQVGDRYYLKASASVRFAGGGERVTTYGWAREAENKAGSDPAQVTGMASSYARKYALCGLFAIDGQGDPDSTDNTQPGKQSKLIGRCSGCGATWPFDSAQQLERARCKCGGRYVLAKVDG